MHVTFPRLEEDGPLGVVVTQYKKLQTRHSLGKY